ncbi:putative lysosomal alpha-mannosidase precursor [Trypanosoma rangeli]|uniref:Alpha-mannosidase n=1 Tax=Trypanosoma rangeli TaxID=5698 RepID=A0A3R7NAI5_TRYRA|nr:putative lysosomal alpha-mannosidase precursor [Trypanosoma rangeli]RNE99561.1 putative lysosomal alpha-mannosidase precursor [Trypanosoma rangeli]|eukprot:RNE99561.1 putative lysosomal alpha-mannosidase precursor [Trypanosoma rangeli]
MQQLVALLACCIVVGLPAIPAYAKTTVHLVAHTHDDMGWLKTVEQYQYGLNNTIQMADVNTILSSVIGGLLVNPKRKFTYVEIGFFSRWWEQQSPATRKIVQALVAEGRLQFANGGWCMHDEASTHFIDMIDQTTIGHRWLRRELNVSPRVGWQIDPFGHSATQGAMLTARVGFLGTFFARVDFQEFEYRAKTGKRQFWWQPSPSMPELRTFAEINLHQTYCSPPHFKWDILDYLPGAQWGGDPITIVDDNTSAQYNVPFILKQFKAEVRANMKVTRGNNIMWTMGCDFNYFSSDLWFSNMDKLINIVNSDGEFAVRYSTPYEYVLAKKEEETGGVVYDTKKGDFFPYASSAHEYWTGYYSSRPALKRLVRRLSSYWMAARQVEFFAGVPTGEVPMMSEALAIAQHHDAITGTAKQHVTFDYVKRLTAAYENDFRGRLRHALSVLPFKLYNAQHCLLSNVSVCSATADALARNGASLTVLVWNPSAHPVQRALVLIPVPRADVNVSGDDVLRYSVFESPVQVGDYSNGNKDWQPYTLGVELCLQRLAMLRLFTPSLPHGGRRKSYQQVAFTQRLESVTKVENSFLVLHFGLNGLLESVTVRSTGQKVAVMQDWCYYNSRGRMSAGVGGAYIMRPTWNATCYPITASSVELRLVDAAMGVVEQRFGDHLVQRVMLRGDVIDVEFTSFGIPIDDGVGRELVARFRTSVKNGDVFYTDSNGREMQRRRVDHRSDYPFTQMEPIAGNFYPVTSLFFINDTHAQFSVFPDAAMAGTSLKSGEVLFVVHRRLLHDDGKGVGEPLNETEFVTSYANCVPANMDGCGRHYGSSLRVRGTLSFTVSQSGPTVMRRVREQQDEKYYTPLVMYSSTSAHTASRLVPHNMSFGVSLPPSLQILTLQLIDKRQLLLRLGHRYAVSEDPERSLPVEVDLLALLKGFHWVNITGIDEVSLTAAEVVRPRVHKVTLQPIDIRTFLCHVSLP